MAHPRHDRTGNGRARALRARHALAVDDISQMSAAVIAAIVAILIPAALGWLFLLRALVAVFLGLRDRRRINATVRAATRMNEQILAARFVEHRTELQRRRQLREFNAKHANAEVVRLTRGGPKEAA
jgi:hypothetical protein